MWLYVPSAYVPESGHSTSDSTEPFQNLARSSTWRGKSIPPQSWQRVCRTGYLTRLLSGLTSPQSTLQHGVDQWIASLAESPASPSVSPASEPEPTTSDGYGPTYSGSFGRVVPGSWESRTYPDLFGMDSPLSSEIWPSSGLMRRGALYPLPKWAPRTSASASSFWPTGNWPTPDTQSHRDGTKLRKDNNLAEGGRHGVSLHHLVAHWQTPATDSFRSRGGNRKDEPGLDQQARMWPTVTAQDAKNNAGPSQYERNTAPLNVEAVKWATPTSCMTTGAGTQGREGGENLQTQVSRLHQPTGPDGPPSSASDPTSRPRLNPEFTDWLMNLVPGWTDCVPLAMPSSSGRPPKPLPSYAVTLESDEGAA